MFTVCGFLVVFWLLLLFFLFFLGGSQWDRNNIILLEMSAATSIDNAYKHFPTLSLFNKETVSGFSVWCLQNLTKWLNKLDFISFTFLHTFWSICTEVSHKTWTWSKQSMQRKYDFQLNLSDTTVTTKFNQGHQN